MQITTKRDLLSEALSTHITKRFSSALDGFRNSIEQVRIRVDDINGPKGGIDKRCTAVLKLQQGSTIAVHSTSNDLYAAIDAVAKKAKGSISRRLEKIKFRRAK